MRAVRDSIGVGGLVIAGIFLLVLVGGAADLLYVNLFEGRMINQHTKNVRHSIGYVDAQNAHSRDLIVQYHGVPTTDSAHRCALISDLRATEGQLQGDEISQDVSQFMAAHSTECGGQ